MGYDGLERSAFCPKFVLEFHPSAHQPLQWRAGCHYFTSDYMRITLVLNAMMERFSYLEHPDQVKLKTGPGCMMRGSRQLRHGDAVNI
ncbi:hypothetical protein AO741_20740 [Pseudomonas sp. TTU2014-105ASC]|nr:hypothetical protein AO741_20740 [Pseudomonas sp. TTU2014-105ASC]